MIIEKTDALCLKISPFSESSHVVTWLTPNHGKIVTVVKGACRPKSMFLGQYDLFYTCELLFYASARGGLHIAKECAPLNSRPTLRADWRAAACASYICDMLNRLSVPGHHENELYQLAVVTLNGLCEDGAAPPPPFLFWFELKLVTALGLAPRLTSCPACGKKSVSAVSRRARSARSPAATKTDAAPRNAGMFSCDRGGFLCATCADSASGEKLPVSPGARAMLTNWRNARVPRAARNTRCAPAQTNELRRLLGAFIQYHLDIDPPSRRIAFDLLAGVKA